MGASHGDCIPSTVSGWVVGAVAGRWVGGLAAGVRPPGRRYGNRSGGLCTALCCVSDGHPPGWGAAAPGDPASRSLSPAPAGSLRVSPGAICGSVHAVPASISSFVRLLPRLRVVIRGSPHIAVVGHPYARLGAGKQVHTGAFTGNTGRLTHTGAFTGNTGRLTGAERKNRRGA